MKHSYLIIAMFLIGVAGVAAFNDTEIQQIADTVYPIVQNVTFDPSQIQNATNAVVSAAGTTSAAAQAMTDAVARLNASIGNIPVSTASCGNITISLSQDQLNAIYDSTNKAVNAHAVTTTCSVDETTMTAAVTTALADRFAQQQQFIASSMNNQQGITQLNTNYLDCLNQNSILKNSYFAANMSINNTMLVFQTQVIEKDNEITKWQEWFAVVCGLLFLSNLPYLLSYMKRQKYH